MQYTIVGSKYGVAAGDFVIDLPEVVDGIPLYGQDGKDNFPRNEAESQMLNEIIAGFQAQQNIITNNTSPEAGLETMTIEEENALKMKQFTEMQIKDPLAADLALKRSEAEMSSFKYAGDITGELGKILPGGESILNFSPKALGEAYQNLLLKSSPEDPKRLMGDISVIASDLFSRIITW